MSPALIFLLLQAMVPVTDDSPDVGEILRAYVEDFRRDARSAEPVTFGIRITDVEDGDFHVVVSGKEISANEHEVRLVSGPSPEPCFFYALSRDTLGKLHRGEMSILTAGGKAFSTDSAPLEIEAMKGFRSTPEFGAKVLPFTFHFWTRGFPEIVPFGPEHTRVTHGANAVLFYYQPGLRLGWFLILPGDHANKDPRSRVNDFPTFFIATKGKCRAKIGGEIVELTAGQSVHVGAGVSHEFLNPFDEPAEGIIVMFGEGA